MAGEALRTMAGARAAGAAGRGLAGSGLPASAPWRSLAFLAVCAVTAALLANVALVRQLDRDVPRRRADAGGDVDSRIVDVPA
jgi:hypothetical protein